ncbi:sensor histidine kinase [Gilvimarinus algae]|uniref:histidine kinase n=1 Tax=Gilvimarinus algae TaxID=3058037 RepID=A0ABT8TG90_9GAMM|nr:ATP-binding protein [Gilvimarinus sp. SDUM040014]MDO3383099.1 ATP-binding protein [Gilvimarinus sp. SDUM040014]
MSTTSDLRPAGPIVSAWKQIGQILRRQGIGQRLLFYIILFSSLVTLLATAVQLYTDYQRDVGQIKSRLADIESSYMASIGASLWNLDVNQLRLQLDGILHLPDIDAVAVYELSEGVDRPLSIVLGEFKKNQAIVREYAISRDFSGEMQQVGLLKVQASLQAVYARLWDKAIVILLSQGIKTFLVSLFILYVFYRLVTVHLGAIARHLAGYQVVEPGPALALQRKSRQPKDELDQVVDAFNQLTGNLEDAYQHMREINTALADDIIARREAEEEVKRLNAVLEERVIQRTAQLEAANRELASFCYSVSHDLRAPLRRIEGFRRILAEQLSAQGAAERSGHYLSRIETGTQEMNDMIDSFLQLSRSTQCELQVVSVDLSAIAESVLQELQQHEPQRRARFDVKPQVRVDGDRSLMTLLLRNLLHNAWKYSGKKDMAHIAFGFTQADNGSRTYYVSDQGDGFDMAYADRLFSPFNRLHTSEEFEGTGIGLATVQRIVARHGGRIWAEAEPGKGARFYFTLWDRNRDDKQGNDIAGGGQSG